MTSCYRLEGIRFNRKFLVVKQACRKDTEIPLLVPGARQGRLAPPAGRWRSRRSVPFGTQDSRPARGQGPGWRARHCHRPPHRHRAVAPRTPPGPAARPARRTREHRLCRTSPWPASGRGVRRWRSRRPNALGFSRPFPGAGRRAAWAGRAGPGAAASGPPDRGAPSWPVPPRPCRSQRDEQLQRLQQNKVPVRQSQ